MNNRQIFNALKPCLPFYLLALLLILGIKYGYSRAGCEELLWILAPTCWWVRFLSGISFQWVPEAGYVSHSARFIIAKSCSGVQFMTVSAAALVFSFLHRKKTLGQAGRWMLAAAGISYLYTIFVNGLRILMSIYLPRLLGGLIAPAGWLTKERLHSVIGIVVYFTALFLLYQFADQKTQPAAQKMIRMRLSRYLMPLFWYFFMVLGLPFLNGAAWADRQGFFGYARLIAFVCLSLVLLFSLLCLLAKRAVPKLSGFLSRAASHRTKKTP